MAIMHSVYFTYGYKMVRINPNIIIEATHRVREWMCSTDAASGDRTSIGCRRQ